jgi:hypothetical protein
MRAAKHYQVAQMRYYHPLPREVEGVEEGRAEEEADLRAEEETGEAIEECQVYRRNKNSY